VAKFWQSTVLGSVVIPTVTGLGYVSTKAGSNGLIEHKVVAPVFTRIGLTPAEEALKPRQHRR
jgi:hypothetical protein